MDSPDSVFKSEVDQLVRKLIVSGLTDATWLGGGLHNTAALAGQKVFTWGKAEECGQGLGQSAPPIMEPREIPGGSEKSIR